MRVLKFIAGIFPLREVLFFAGYFLFVLYVVEPQLIFQQIGPIFSLRPAFLHEHMLYPGGPADYVWLFLGQMLGLGWPGAVVIALEAWLLCRLTDAYFRRLFARPIAVVRFVGPMLLLVIVSSYDAPLGLPLWVLIVLGLGTLYAYLPVKELLVRLAVLAAMSAAFYYLAKPASILYLALSYLLLGGLAAAVEISRSKRWSALPGALLAMGICLLAAVAGERFFPFPSGQGRWANVIAITYTGTIILYSCLFLFVPIFAGLVAGVIGAWKRLARNRVLPRLMQDGPAWRAVYWFVGTAVILGVSATVAFHAYAANVPTKRFLQTRYYAESDMWNEVLSAARRVPADRFDHIVSADVNLALYHTGRLGEDMFAFQQEPWLLLDYYNIARETRLDRISKLYLELGRFNDAEHTSYEALCLIGDHPAILKRLAVIHMVKDQPAIAKVYLNSLCYDIVYGPWARDYLRKIAADEHLGGDKFVQDLRRQRLAEDDVGDINRAETVGGIYFFIDRALLDSALAGKPNRMAFEFMMANHLLWGDLDSLADRLCLLKRVGYDHIPRLYQEAALIHEALNHRPIDTGGLEISKQTVQQYQKFLQIMRQCGGNRITATPMMAKEGLLDSYFFYYAFKEGVRHK